MLQAPNSNINILCINYNYLHSISQIGTYNSIKLNLYQLFYYYNLPILTLGLYSFYAFTFKNGLKFSIFNMISKKFKFKNKFLLHYTICLTLVEISKK